MNFYAKSKKHILKANEKEKVEKEYLNLIDEMGDILSKAEIAALENEKNNIINDVYEEQKTLREHLDETVECAERFFEQYGKYFTEKEKALIFTACKYHDVGKANLVFQANISDEVDTKYKNIKQIPHGFLSALTLSLEKLQTKIDDITNDDFKCLVTAVYYHHTRDDEFNADEIRKFSDNYFKDCFNEFSEISDWKTKMVNRGKYLFNIKKNDGVGIDEDLWHEYMLIKGMLNKFDWTVSSGKIGSEENIDFEKKKLINNIDKRYGKNLRTVQQYMREKADSNVVIIAPTGSGKTEAALYWLNGEKGFYTLPLKVSSNAIYKRIREEYSFKDVALLHSESLQKYIEEPLIGDRLIFSLLNRQQITEESFTQELNFLHLKKEASKLIVRELENSLKKTIKHKELGRQVSYQYLIRLELYKLVKHIIGEKEYEGFKIWW